MLIIAGAGSGKTNTLAYRVAHLVAQRRRPAAHPAADVLAPRRGGDGTPGRPDPASRVRRDRRGSGRPRCAGPGTFHSVGARLLREYAERIGLQRVVHAFTIAAMPRICSPSCATSSACRRHEEPLSDQGHVPRDLLARRQRRGVARPRCSSARIPWCAQWEAELKTLFDAYVGAKQAQNVLDYDDLLLYWSHMVAEPCARAGDRRALRPRARRRVPGHQSAAGVDPAGAEAGRPRRHRRRRRCAVDLFVPRGDGAQHPRFSAAVRRRPRASSRSSATIARRSRFSTPPTR